MSRDLNLPFSNYRDRKSGKICAFDVEPGKDVDVEIGPITFEMCDAVPELGIKAEEKMVAELLRSDGKPKFVDLKGAPLRWIVNPTNRKTIFKITGTSIPSHWTGRVIVLFHHVHIRKGEEVPSIRVRPRLSKHDKGPRGSVPNTSPAKPVDIPDELSPDEIAQQFYAPKEEAP